MSGFGVKCLFTYLFKNMDWQMMLSYMSYKNIINHARTHVPARSCLSVC